MKESRAFLQQFPVFRENFIAGGHHLDRSGFCFEFSTVNCQLSSIALASALSCQLSTVNCQASLWLLL
ncbi:MULTISPECIES: hypothetical protein [unclassified Microcoleus]|uniref:hypothetical protein n=1 Tax=unclassified Microcoleus TaxID=2642155 RepID=UPI0025FA9EC9|nr:MULTISPECIES: hypothetical protein [unclassified Microcoleus]